MPDEASDSPATQASASPAPLPEPDGTNAPARLSDPALAGLSFFLVVIGYFTVGAATQLMNVAFGLWFAEVEIFFGVPWVLGRLFRRDPLGEQGLNFPGAVPLALGFAAGAVNLVTVVFPLQAFSQTFVPDFLKKISFDVAEIFAHQTPLELAILFAAVGIAAPVGEEFFFRGTLQRGLQKLLGWEVAIGVTATLFSLLHLDAVGFLARLELGVLFGVLAWKTGSIWPGVFAHAANNIVSTALFFVFKDQADLEAEAAEQPNLKYMVLLLVIGVPVVLSVVRLVIRSVRVPPLPARIPERAPRLWATVAPWLLAGLSSIALLGVVDRRGIELNVKEQIGLELPRESAKPDPAEKQIRTVLERKRADARAGRIPISEYLEERKQAKAQLQALGAHDHVPKVPRTPIPAPTPAPAPTP